MELYPLCAIYTYVITAALNVKHKRKVNKQSQKITNLHISSKELFDNAHYRKTVIKA